MTPQLQLSLSYFALGVVWILVALPLVKGSIPRNRIYGFRTPKTLSSDETWYAANRYFGKDFVHCGRILVGASILLTLASLAGVSVYFVSVAGLTAMLLPLIVAVVRAFLYLRTL